MTDARPKIILNAADYSFGRLASRIAFYLQEKHNPGYRPNLVGTTKVVVKNLDKVKFSGTKLDSTLHHRYTGYPGGIKTQTMGQLFARAPKQLLIKAVSRMLPKNRLNDRRMKNLVIT